MHAAEPDGGDDLDSLGGLNAELTLKPDIGAPGGSIRSTYPLSSAVMRRSAARRGLAARAGAVARCSRPTRARRSNEVGDTPPEQRRPEAPVCADVLDADPRQGAGMLDIMGAINATTMLSPGKISLGEGNGGSAKITLRNSSGSPVTYDLSNEPAAGNDGKHVLADVLDGLRVREASARRA